MNTMNIPGFTAEDSLYTTSGHYRAMAGTPSAFADGQGVLPQLQGLLSCLGNCSFPSDPKKDYSNCVTDCFWAALLDGSGSYGGSIGGPGGGKDRKSVV